MRRRLLVLVPLLGVLLFGWGVAPVGSPGIASADGEQSYEGKRALVTCTSCPQALAKQAVELLEAALPRYEAELPYALPADQKLIVHLYGTADEYKAAVREAGAGALADNLAATVNSTSECYLVVQPRTDPAYLAMVGGLPEMTRYLLYHEATHQFTYRAHPPSQRWPDWYGEGMAEHMAKLLTKATASRDAPTPIVVEDRVQSAREALDRGRLARFDWVLHSLQTEISSERHFSYYACWGGLYGLLAADPGRMRTLHARLRAIDTASDGTRLSPRDLEEAFANALEKVYGPLDALTARWQEAIRATTPEWFEGLRSTQRLGAEWVCAAFPDSTAYAVRTANAPSRPFTLSVEWKVADLGKRQAEIYIAYETRENPRFVKVAFRSEGSVTLLVFAEGNWQERYRFNANVAPELLTVDRWHRARLDVDAKTIAVEVDGKRLLDAPVPPGFDTLGRRIGIGARDGVATFRSLEVKAKP